MAITGSRELTWFQKTLATATPVHGMVIADFVRAPSVIVVFRHLCQSILHIGIPLFSEFKQFESVDQYGIF
jgi:hypothetical protein